MKERLMSVEREEFRSIEGYEGLYEVSNFGRVRSLDHESVNRDGVLRRYKGRVLKPAFDADGYLIVGLHKDGKSQTCRIHRLVMQAFTDNYNNLPQVDHKDGDRTNNHIDNLRWCTNEQNVRYSLDRRCTTNKRHPPKTEYEKVCYEEETWVDVEGTNGCYRVSSNGNVYSVERDLVKCNGAVTRIGGKMLKQWVNKQGAPMVTIVINGIKRQKSVASIVAENLVPNPNGLDVVIHEDGDRLNNKAENLYWGTWHDIGYQKYERGTRSAEAQCKILRSEEVTQKNLEAISRPIVRDDGKWYASIREATDDLGCNKGSIYNHLRGRLKTIHGHTFTYADKQPA